MPNKDIVVIGASTGGIEALQVLVAKMPPDFTGSLFVVVHVGATGPNFLGSILDRLGPLRAATAENGQEIKPGRIYVAPADYHLLLDKRGYMLTRRGPKENRFRPAIDALFRSAAYAFGPRVVGVVLTGLLDDGTAGLWAIKERGGTAMIQHPEEALAPPMPMNALKHVEVDHIATLSRIPHLLAKLAETSAEEKGVHLASKEICLEGKCVSHLNLFRTCQRQRSCYDSVEVG